MNKNTCERARTWVLTMLMTLSIAVAGALLPQTAFAQEDPATPIAGQKITLPAVEGIEILNLDTNTVEMSVNDSSLFNPASNTKLATTLLVLQKFGPDYIFKTVVQTDGTISNDGVLHGNLYVDGNYMLFGDDQAHALAQILNDKGIRKIEGDLYVSTPFTMRLQFAGLDAGRQLMTILDPNNPNGANRHIVVVKKKSFFNPAAPPPPPQVRITGKVNVGTAKGDTLTVLATYNSPPLKDIIKIMLCYSDNTMAEKFGQMIGGPAALNDLVIKTLGADPAEVNFATTSGLGINRISPRAMMKVVVALRQYAIDHNLTLADFLPVAGVDDGTLKGRPTDLKGVLLTDAVGSIVGKTGTLNPTDQGVSALSGEMHTGGASTTTTTSNTTTSCDEEDYWNCSSADNSTTSTTPAGTYLFVIFEMHGDVTGFRERQDQVVTDFEKAHGGPQKITYTPILPRITKEGSWDLSQPAAAPATGN